MQKSLTYSWKSPANIALIKYWGKHGNQLPNNPSLSMTLAKCTTSTSIKFEELFEHELPDVNFQFHGKSNHEFKNKIEHYLNSLFDEMPFLTKYNLYINSSNNFPHSSGIASSASSMSSLALCLCSAEQTLNPVSDINFMSRASHIARLGSGSASRSIFGGFVSWGKSKFVENSSDNYGTSINNKVHSIFKKYADAILIVKSTKKSISSSNGHGLMDKHLYRNARYNEATINHETLLNCLEHADEGGFVKIVEHEALTLHALLMTSNPWRMLLEPNSIEIINRIRDFRADTKLPVCFSIDAGPNVHLIYNSDYSEQVIQFIECDLKKYCENEQWINDMIGDGPELIKTETISQ